ncbi:MAG: hypothetical protein OET90_08010, partial [Desulfuromonadales bacterium]|nr:hypothetical protein [Desulfuromonadales bacterium]
MSSKHYQIAIIGSSLAARIAAALLAKSGRKVLFLRSEERLTSPWFFSSTFLEQLLGNLGGRGCFGPPRPFQVLSSKSRLCINGDAPLEDEMLREFGDHADPIIARFDKLLHTGQTLEALLWENDGLPLPGVKAAARLRYLCLRHKLRLSELNAPLHKLFDGLAPNCIEFCNNLFQGLSLQPYHSLSMAHGALLWAHALRSESILEPDFGELLEKRFNQFHGSSDSLSNLQQLDYDGSRYTGGIMKEGG